MMSGASTVIRRPPGWSPAPFRGLVILAGARGGTSAPADEDAADSVSVSDALLVPVLASIGDSVALAEAVAEFRAVLAADAVTLSEAAQAVLAAANSTSDQVATSDVIRAGFAQVTADTVAITDVAGLASSIAATITDLLAAAEALDHSNAAVGAISDSVTLSDVGIAGLVAIIADTVTAAAAAIGVAAQSVVITDAALFVEGLDVGLIRQALLEDGVTATEDLSSALAAIQNLRDAIVCTVEVVTPSGDRYVGWVYAPGSQAASEISGYDFFELVTHPLGTIAAKPDGLYLLRGTEDDGQAIPWYLRTGKLPIGEGMQTRPDSVFVAGVSEGDMTLRVTASGGRRGEQESDYVLDRISDGVAEQFRAKLGKGLRGTYVQFALFGEDDMDISGLMVRFIKTSRRT